MRKKCFLKTKLSTRWSVTEGILTLLQHLNNRVENDLVISLSITVLWTCWLIVRVKEVLKRDCCRCGIRFSSAWKKVIIEAHIVKTTSPIIAKENLGTRCFPVRPDLNHSISIFPYLPLGPPWIHRVGRFSCSCSRHRLRPSYGDVYIVFLHGTYAGPCGSCDDKS